MSSAEVVADLTRRLAVIGGTSVAAGAGLALTSRPAVRAFGLQSAGWGVINLGIAAVARVRSGGTVDSGRVRTILWINTVADLGYVAVGVLLAVHRPSLGGRLTPEQAAGHGWAVVAQGFALAALDATYARRL